MNDASRQPLAPGRAVVLHLRAGHPDVTLDLPAAETSLPLIRQALRSLGEAVRIDAETLEDIELAVTEACANAIEHAYEEGGGTVRVELVPGPGDLAVGVVDHGVGIKDFVERPDGGRGFGLAMIRDIASRVEFRPGDGTDLRMEFATGSPAERGADAGLATQLEAGEPAERIMRRMVALIAAQLDMSTERVVEALLVAELVAHNAFRRLSTDHAEVRIDREGDGFHLCVGPLEPGGAEAAVADSTVPVVGPVLERLAGIEIDDEPEGEYLKLRIEPR